MNSPGLDAAAEPEAAGVVDAADDAAGAGVEMAGAADWAKASEAQNTASADAQDSSTLRLALPVGGAAPSTEPR